MLHPIRLTLCRVLLALPLFWASSAPATAATPAVPDGPVKIVVPFPPGGSADVLARVIGEKLALMIQQPVIIDNRPGADGAIAAEWVAKSKPDGRTLFMATYGAMSAVPAMHKHPEYNVETDFTPIAATGTFAFFLFANPDLPATTLPELIRYVHDHPTQVNYGTGNAGGIVAMAELATLNQLAMTQVPYKGEVPAVTDLISGRIQLMFGTPTNTLPWVRQGKLRALVTLLDQRSPLMPDVPTMAQAGLPNIPITPWAGLFGPPHMPAAMTQRLATAVNAILENAEVREKLTAEGFEIHGSTPAQLARQVKQQLSLWATTIHEAGIEME